MKNLLTELIVNGGFETGTLPPWTVVAGVAAVTTTLREHSGNFAATIGPSSAIQQVISEGLKKDRVYRFSGALSDNGSGSIDVPENPTTVVTLQFIDDDGNVLGTFTKTFNAFTIPENTEGNFREFNILAESPKNTTGAIVRIQTAADGAGNNTIVVDDFSLIQENGN